MTSDEEKAFNFELTDKEKAKAQEMFETAEGVTGMVELYTGMKNQFINAGWSNANAEAMVVTFTKMANAMQTAKVETEAAEAIAKLKGFM